jgi:hypothetical protein
LDKARKSDIETGQKSLAHARKTVPVRAPIRIDWPHLIPEYGDESATCLDKTSGCQAALTEQFHPEFITNDLRIVLKEMRVKRNGRP